MLITNLSMQKKDVSRVNISLDDKFYGVIFDELVYQNRLKVGNEVEEQDIINLINESSRSFCKNDAFNNLSRYVKTEQELKDYLYNKGYHKDAVDYALSAVKEYNLIDDEKYADSYYKLHKDSKSCMQIKQALLNKGIKDNIVDKVCIFDKDEEIVLARKLVEKLERVEDGKITYKNLVRLKRQLLQRGITYDVISIVTSDYDVVYED